MARTGRPKKEINQEQFEKLCAICCTQKEIADFFDCSIDTVNRWCKRTYKQTFADTYEKMSVTGKISLRRWQFKSAEAGNVTMQIWLGKQYLGQREQIETDNKNDNTININVSAATEDIAEGGDDD